MNAPAIRRNLRRTRHIPKRSQQDEIAAPAFHSRIIVFFLRYPITAKTSSNWMVLFANASYLNYCELKIASIARQTRRVEQSSDRQVALNCHCEGHFVFLQINNLSAHIVINFVYIFSCQGGATAPPLNPLFLFFFEISLS